MSVIDGVAESLIFALVSLDGFTYVIGVLHPVVLERGRELGYRCLSCLLVRRFEITYAASDFVISATSAQAIARLVA
jgi:hypothetical protein